MAVEACHGLMVAACLIEQSDLFKHKVVAEVDERGVFAEECQAIGMGVLQLLIKLVKLHENA